MADATSLWNNRKFTRLWSARLVSRFGGALSYVVLIWITYADTGSALAVAYVGLASFVPIVAVGVFSGAIVDRYDRRRVIILSVLGRSAAMAALVLGLDLIGFHLDFVLLAVIGFSILSTFFGPGSQALLPEIVPRGALADANGLFESTESIVSIGASAVAGVLIVVVGSVPSLGIDAVTYLVAAMFIVLIGATITQPAVPRESERLLSQVQEGFRYLRRTIGLLELTTASFLLNFLFSFILTFLVVYSTNLLHGGALIYAGLEAVLAAGIALGALLVGRLRLTRYTGRLWAYSALAQGAAIIALVLVPGLYVALPAFFALGVMNGLLNITWLSTVQAIVPERMQGRYFAIDTTLGYASIPLAQVIGGVLIVVRGVSFTFLIAGVGLLAAGIPLLFMKELHKVGYDPRASK